MKQTSPAINRSGFLRAAALLAAVVLAITAWTALPGSARADEVNTEKTTAVDYYFDTVVTLTFYGADDTLQVDMLNACARYERLLSKTVEGSDVWNINHAEGQPVTVDPETWDILRRAQEISRLTDGDFSVTIAPLTVLWDFTGGTERMPTDEERLAALPLVDDTLIELGDNNTVTLPAGHSVDLGGIAKGYIADQLAAMAQGRCYGAVINLGGNTYVVGQKPTSPTFKVAVTDPDNPSGYLAVVETTDRTVVTSGTYERYFVKDGVTYHHILDPETGSSAETDLTAATIIGTDSMSADAFATACIVKGSEGALQLMKDNGLDGLVVTTDGTIITTAGFTDKYSIAFTEGRTVLSAQ